MLDLLFVVTAMSLLVAATTSVLAWRAMTENRRRSEARVAQLAEVLHAEDPPDDRAVAMPRLLQSSDTTRGGRALLPMTAVATALVAVVVSSWAMQPASSATAVGDAGKATSERIDVAPLELLALTDARGPAGELELRGEVHNPANGSTLDNVTAVALLFDRQGVFVSSGRAPLEARGIMRGSDATFRISVPDADSIGRYRVSFRTADRIIPHTDRRDEP